MHSTQFFVYGFLILIDKPILSLVTKFYSTFLLCVTVWLFVISMFAPQAVAIVMDLLTDLQILQDLLDASSRRGVAVYTVLEARGVPHFLDMCTRLQINAVHLRVRSEICKHWKA